MFQRCGLRYILQWNYPGSVFSALFTNDLLIRGYSNNGDSVFNIFLSLPHPVIEPGTYITDNIANVFAFVTAPGADIYTANASTPIPTGITVELTDYNIATRILKGKFYGRATDTTGNTIDIADGAFNVFVNVF